MKLENIKVHGVAIKAGISKNGIKYTPENLGKTAHELADKPILKDHKALTDNTVGRTTKASFDVKGESVMFEGWIKEDGTGVTEKIADGRIKEVSIGAAVEQLLQENAEDNYVIAEGIHYLELSTTPTPGVEGTSIMSLMANESRALNITEAMKRGYITDDEDDTDYETEESHTPHGDTSFKKNKQEEQTMTDNKIQEAAIIEENKRLKAQLEEMKLAKKKEACEAIAKLNPELKVDELMNESDERLALRQEYETKMASARKAAEAQPAAKPQGKAIMTPETNLQMQEAAQVKVLHRGEVKSAIETLPAGTTVVEKTGNKLAIWKMRDYSKEGYRNSGHKAPAVN